MRTSEGIRRKGGAWLVGAALLLSLAVVPAATEAAEQGPSLDLLRQFHSYAPARRALVSSEARRRQDTEALMHKGRAAWRTGDYALARKLFAKAFDKGEALAGWYLGYLYSSGRGGRVDHEKAFRYYRALARRYDPDERDLRRLMLSVDALVRVADYYRTGIGPKKKRRNLRRAFRLYNLAAAHNHAGAFYGMAMVALASKGRVARQRWAVGWLKRAAMAGHAPAAAELSRLAARGIPGVLKPDPVAAEAWRIIALRLRGPAVAAPLAPTTAMPGLAAAQSRQAARLADHFLASYMQMLRARTALTENGMAPVQARPAAATGTVSPAPEQ